MKLLLFLLLISLVSESHASEAVLPTLYLIGDSTMSKKAKQRRPETGWGEMLAKHFSPTITIANHALNGRSSKSYIDEGRWNKVVDNLRTGDFVFIQFGHNDQKKHDPSRYTIPNKGYKENLRKLIIETKAKKATPILLSSIVRRKFNKTGKLIDTLSPYPQVMQSLAKELKVDFIDLNSQSNSFFNQQGFKKSLSFFLHLPKNHPNYPDGIKDDTHLNAKGANFIATLVKESLCDQKHSLSQYIQEC